MLYNLIQLIELQEIISNGIEVMKESKIFPFTDHQFAVENRKLKQARKDADNLRREIANRFFPYNVNMTITDMSEYDGTLYVNGERFDFSILQDEVVFDSILLKALPNFAQHNTCKHCEGKGYIDIVEGDELDRIPCTEHELIIK